MSALRRGPELRVERYDLFGAILDFRAHDQDLIDGFSATFGDFRCPADRRPADVTMTVTGAGEGLWLDEGPDGCEVRGDVALVLPAVLERATRVAIDRLAAGGVLAVHAGAVTHRGGAVILAGPSGRGKSTLTLALVYAGLQLLSDEFALLDRDAATILPYRRAVHVRPGTPELVPELGQLLGSGPQPFGAGIRWALPVSRLEAARPGCLGAPAPLRHVLILGPREPAAPRIEPLGHGAATVALLRGTPHVANDVSACLGQVAQAVSGARCGYLVSGTLTETVGLVRAWIDDGAGGD